MKRGDLSSKIITLERLLAIFKEREENQDIDTLN
jgi:hypothetical protein